MHTKKKMGILALATGLCLSIWLAGCGKTEDKDTGSQAAEMTGMSAESTPDVEAPAESAVTTKTTEARAETETTETPAESLAGTEAETTEADTSAEAGDYVEIWCYGELAAKVPAKPLDSWTSDYEMTEEELKEEAEYFGYIGYNYHDEKDNWYGYNFYPDSNTWKLVMFWPYDNTGTGYYLYEEDGTWYQSDGRDG